MWYSGTRNHNYYICKFPICSWGDPKHKGFLFAKAIAGSPVNITMTVLSQSEIRVSQGHPDLADDLGRGDMGADKDSRFGGGFNYFLNFTPNFGEDVQFY